MFTVTVYEWEDPLVSVTVMGSPTLKLPAGNSPKSTLAWPGSASTVAETKPALARSMRPPPLTIGLVKGDPVRKLLTGSPVVTSADLICSGDHVGWSCFRIAAEPATWGVAMLVPEKKAKQGGELQEKLGTDDNTLTPGATTSGLILPWG